MIEHFRRLKIEDAVGEASRLTFPGSNLGLSSASPSGKRRLELVVSFHLAVFALTLPAR
jgi:hypothetical protein